MMAESVESRKFERKPLFDVPLPMRRRVDNGATASEDTNNSNNSDQPAGILPSTMKFSLLSRKGNRQQTRSIDLPADSTFAVAMKSQQQAETEEKQRIKNLVLNYDLSSTENETEGIEPKQPQNPYNAPRIDKAGNSARMQRGRKLQLSDMDWT